MRFSLLTVAAAVLMLSAFVASAQDGTPPAPAAPGAAETAQVAATQAAQLRTSQREAVRATAQAFATQGAPPPEQAAATAQAIQPQLPAPIGELTAEQTETLLTTLTGRGSVSIGEASLDVVYAVEEEAVSQTLTTALFDAGYEPSAVAADFINEGIIVTLENATISEGEVGRVVIFAELDTDGGRVAVNLIFASLDDNPLPPETLERLDVVLRQALSDSLVLLTDAVVNYAVTNVVTTDNDLVVGLSIPFAAAG